MSYKLKNLTIIFLLLFGFFKISIGQEKGKISGVVIDAETQEKLPGANIIIEGTNIGTATNSNGEYFLINLSPNKYTLIASFIGYQKMIVRNVIVNSGRTTQINFKLKSKTISSKEVVIVAEKPVIQQDVSNSQDVAFGEDLIAMPAVTSVSGFVGRQSGVEGSSIRGGSIDETSYMIDGAVMVDPTTNKPYTGIPLSAIKEVSVIKGGFNAEYGNVRSGMVTITTKEGSKDRYSGSIDVRMNLPHQKHFGPSMFSPDNYYLRPYFEPRSTWDGTENWENWELLQSPATFQGWKKWAKEQKNLNLTPEEAREIFIWTHTVEGKKEWGVKDAKDLGQKSREYGNKPDWNGELSFSGPIPLVSKYLGDLTFFASYRLNKTYLAVPFSRDNNWSQDGQLKLTSHLKKGMKLSLQGIISGFQGVNKYIGNSIDGTPINANSAIKVANSNNMSYYWESSFTPLDINKKMLSMNFEHVPSTSTFYTVNFGVANTKYLSEGYLHERDTTVKKIYGNVTLDEVPWGWTKSERFLTQIGSPDKRRFGGNGGMIWDKSQGTTYNLKFDYFTQLNSYNAIKTGTEISYTDINVFRAKFKARTKKEVRELLENKENTKVSKPSDWFSREFKAYPIRAAYYLQDKIEVEGMVANLGVRVDYFNTNTTNYFIDRFSKYFEAQYADNIALDSIPHEKTKGIFKVSPRLGVAFPISEKAKLYFNYGHFYAYPKSDDLYGMLRGKDQKIEKIGNPAADLPKTISYELGVELNIADEYLLHLAGYYKDVSDQLAKVEFIGLGSVRYKTVLNQNIEDIRGFEVRIEKNRGKWFKGWLNFSYMSSNSGDIGRKFYYEEEERNIREGILDFDQSYRKAIPRPYIRGNFEFFTSDDFMRSSFLNNWHLGIFPIWKSGSYSSYSPGGKDKPEFANNIHWPDYWNVDLKLSKYFNIAGGTWVIYLEARNVFNFKIFKGSVNYGFSSADDRRSYLESLHLPLYRGKAYQDAGLTAGNDKIGDLRSPEKPYINDPNLTHSLWGNPRNIIFGLRIEF